MEKEAIKLIDRLYKDLYLDEQVLHHSTGNKYDKFNNIKDYLKKLESIHTKVGETERHKAFLKKMYYDKYVIKKEDIPESYYHHQEEIALERGLGHIKIIESQKKELQQEVIENQKRSLDVWLDYFLSEDAKVYPFWAKYWAFQGMLKLGTYDKKEGTFTKRTKNTVAPFCDLNREALSMSIDMVIRMVEKEEISDKDLEVLVKTGSFSKIYTYILTKVLNDNKNIVKRNIGQWKKYNQGSDHMELVRSLQGYNTGWCTAGESTAKTQLQAGDFYVYYTLDENNEYKVPRIAIRMEGNKIGEIRGVAKDQNIESEMEEVLEEKLKEFPDKEEYYKKVSDMKELTKIYKKHQNKEELSKEELTFLYEINDKIKGFGYEEDPRIEEIKNERGREKKDLALIFDCDESRIALKEYELTKDTILYYGSLDLRSLTSAKGLELPQSIVGSLYLSGLTSAEGLKLPQSIGGSLYLRSLTSAAGLELPQSIVGDLDLRSLTSAEGLKLPQSIGGSLYLRSLASAEGLELPQSIGESLDLSSLTSAKGLELPQSIVGSLYLSSLTSTKGLELPQSIGGYLDLRSLTSAAGLKLPQSISGYLDLSGLTSAKGLKLPQSIGVDLDLKSLTNAEGLIIPEPLTYYIYMDCFTITPENVGEYRNNKRM